MIQGMRRGGAVLLELIDKIGAQGMLFSLCYLRHRLVGVRSIVYLRGNR